MTRARLAVAAVIAPLLLVGACGSDAPKKSALPRAVEACKILTPEDVAPILGPAGAGTPRSGVQDTVVASACAYTAEADSTKRLFITVQVALDQSKQRNEAIKTLRQEEYRDYQVSDVPGLGDAALWAAGSGANQLAIFTGDYFIAMTFPPATTQEAAVKLAQGVVSRLPKTKTK